MGVLYDVNIHNRFVMKHSEHMDKTGKLKDIKKKVLLMFSGKEVEYYRYKNSETQGNCVF